jgi:hypothetical protein
LKTRITASLLLLLITGQGILVNGHVRPEHSDIIIHNSEGKITASIYNSETFDNISHVLELLSNGVPVIFYGNDSIQVSEIYQTRLVYEDGLHREGRLVVSGLWVQRLGNRTIEHLMQVYDLSFSLQDSKSVYKWLNETGIDEYPTDYIIEGTITDVNHHNPYGSLETRTEILRVEDLNREFDWYDVTVEQRLVPGINYTDSSWKWKWLTYTMNGTYGTSNVKLTDYDQPPSKEPPKGPFSFLWRILGFDLRNIIPWLNPPKPEVQGSDMSDFSLEIFRTRYSAPDDYQNNEPFTKRHHYVLRTKKGESPRFWQQTQVRYIQEGDFAQVPYITSPLAAGYIGVLR